MAAPQPQKFQRCPHCQNFVPDLATVCMYCRRDIAPPKKKPLITNDTIVALIIAIVLIGIVANMPSSDLQATPDQPGLPPAPTPNVRAEAIRVDYEPLARNTETYVGRYLYYRGQVAQVSEGSNSRYILRVAVTPGNYGLWDDHLYVHYQGEVRLLEDDVADFWLRIDGRKTYRAVLGNQVTIPEATAIIVELAADK